jgi:hypothetical protein
VNLELHGIDAADAKDDGLEALVVAEQPDMRLRAREKLRSLRTALETLRDQGYEFVRLGDVARVFGALN